MGVSWESVYASPSNSIWAEAMSFWYSVESSFSCLRSSTMSGEKVRRCCSACSKMSVPCFSSSCGRNFESKSAARKMSSAA